MNWDTQRQVWEYVFKDLFNIRPSETSLIFTEPVFNFPSIQDTLNEILFEGFQFSSILISNATTLSAAYQLNMKPECPCCLVVDTGYSFTHIVPYYQGRMLLEGIRRIDIGGKLMTNHLKEIVSYRQLHVLDETFVMNQVKEDLCYVTQDLYKDMDIAKIKGPANSIMREYVLPDFTTVRKGFVCEPGSSKSGSDEQSLRLTNERFTVPEILFHPSDIGVDQMGIAEAIVDSIEGTPKAMHPHLYNNILLTGGNACFSGFRDRLFQDVRKLSPDIYDLNVTLPSQPIDVAWRGGKARWENNVGQDYMEFVSLGEYKEYGHSLCHKQFRENQTWRGTKESGD